jgi:hypothetical protein
MYVRNIRLKPVKCRSNVSSKIIHLFRFLEDPRRHEIFHVYISRFDFCLKFPFRIISIYVHMEHLIHYTAVSYYLVEGIISLTMIVTFSLSSFPLFAFSVVE